MPRYIVQRSNPAAGQARPHPGHGVRLVRTFSMGGRVFDVFVADSRETFRCFTARSGINGSDILR